MEYRILEDEDKDALAKKVTEYLAKGWQVVGGVAIGYSVTPEPESYHYTLYGQAVILPAPIVIGMDVALGKDKSVEVVRDVLQPSVEKAHI